MEITDLLRKLKNLQLEQDKVITEITSRTVLHTKNVAKVAKPEE